VQSGPCPFALGERTGALMIRTPVPASTSSKAAVNLLSRSCIRTRQLAGAVAEVHEQVAGLLSGPRPSGMSGEGLTSTGHASYGTFQCRPASLRTCGMNESVIWSAGCRLPPALNCTVPQAAGPCATASGGPPALARNVSWIPPP
jgi:hypothetical protein